MKTISMRELQRRIRYCVNTAQRDRVVVTRHGLPAAVIIGVQGADWETVALQTSPAFWRTIQQRRGEETVSFEEMKRLAAGHKDAKRRRGKLLG